MKIFIITFAAFGLLALSACKTTVQDGPTRIIVDDHYHNNGDFCPPGQAKKGRC